MKEYRVVVSTDNGTSFQAAFSDIHVLAFVKNALEEGRSGRIVLIIEPEE